MGSPPARIAIDYTSAVTQGGGIGRYTRELVRAVARQDGETDFRLFVAAGREAALPEPPGPNFSYCLAPLNAEWFARLRASRAPIETWTGQSTCTRLTTLPVRRGVRTL